jgi:ApaG protein
MYYENTQGIEVEVTPRYLLEESSPETCQFVFTYTITISNRSENSVQLLSRHWIITDGAGTVREVKGDGVVGEQPKLDPGQSHTYSSFSALETPTGNMRGTFQMVNHLGASFDVKIPLFFLRDLKNVH